MKPSPRCHITSMCDLWISLIAGMISGCVCVGPDAHPNVAASIESRTDHTIGPVASCCDSPFPPSVDPTDGLTEEEAASIALWNNTAFQELLVDLDLSRADLIEAGQLTNPQIQTMFPLSVKQWEFALWLPLESLWVRPRRVAAAQLEQQRVAERLAQDGLNVVRDARIAWADLLLANERLALAEYGAEIRNENSRRADAMLRGGAMSALDVSPVRIEALLARQEVVQAQQAAEVAGQRLRMTLGLPFTEMEVEPVASPDMPYLLASAEELVSQAISSRPDLQAANLAIVANERRAQLARYDYINITGILPDINSDGEKGFEAGPGLNLTLPIFHRNQGAKLRTCAQLEKSRRTFSNLRNMAVLEVRQAHAQFVQAQQELDILRAQVMPEADAAYQRMRRALNEDAVSTFNVIQSTSQLLIARQRELNAAAQLRRATAELERSVGWRLFDKQEPNMEGTSLSQRGQRQFR